MAPPDFTSDWLTLAHVPEQIAATVFATRRRVLLFGAPGAGKSALVAALARELARLGRGCDCIGADPGSPAFGVPGAVARAQWRDGAWQVIAMEALCTLDAGRFRLPLVAAVRRLANEGGGDAVLIDSPGVVRGLAGSELLPGLLDATDAQAVVLLHRAGSPWPMARELRGSALPVFVVHPHADASRPGDAGRARGRTGLWDAYLRDCAEQEFDLERLTVVGTPPPAGAPGAWIGRQIGFLDHGRTRALGEVVQLDGAKLIVRAPQVARTATTLLVRDAQRAARGRMQTAVPFVTEPMQVAAPFTPTGETDEGPRIVGRVGVLNVRMLNGVFGDPVLHAQPQYSARGLLFDLGGGERLSARIAHQVSDVFITHAHLDHIAGFVSLLRSRIGDFPVCRIHGPPGLAGHIAGFMRGVLWDRAGERTPRFDVFELHGDVVHEFALDARDPRREPARRRLAVDGVLLREAGFRVRAITLDHATPVLAFAFEPDQQLNVRNDRLLARGLAPGPWLGALKTHVLAGELARSFTLPNGDVATVGAAAAELVLVTPGKRLVYATDFADTPANREHLVAFARNAHTLFCEATFLETDREHAQRTAHLTTRACAEIANAAEVARLVPFHFSRRYAHDVQRVYAEIAATCPRAVVPRSVVSPCVDLEDD